MSREAFRKKDFTGNHLRSILQNSNELFTLLKNNKFETIKCIFKQLYVIQSMTMVR